MRPSSSRGIRLLFPFLVLMSGCDEPHPDRAEQTRATAAAAKSVDPPPAAPAAHFVGAARCAACHAEQARAWRGSHHDRAMEVSGPASVEGRFEGQTLQHFDLRWRFLRSGDDYRIELTDPESGRETLAVDYTFGVDPLQQYLVARPDGRYQALPVAWDARPAAEGGQRWLHLQPGARSGRGDPLHWDALAYSWNSQCGACHSTGFRKGFEATTGRFETSWAEPDVACEACHGPGSAHATHHAGNPGGDARA